MSRLVQCIAATIAASAAPATAVAQSAWIPASEIVGQPLQVTTGGVRNVVTLRPDGRAVIDTPLGHEVGGTWTATDGRLCLTSGPQECWPYTSPFRAGQPVSMTSSCNSVSTWLALATNPAPAPAPVPAPPPPEAAGERGR